MPKPPTARPSPITGRWVVLIIFATVALVVALTLVAMGPGGRPPASAPGGASPGATAPPGGGGTTDPNASPRLPTAVPTDGSGQTLPPIPKTTKVIGPHSVEPEELIGYVWPLRRALMTSRMGARDFGGFLLIDGEEVHDGLDLATRCGDDIRAAHDGRVIYAGRDFDVHLGYQGKPQQIYARLEQQGRVNTLPIVIVIDDGNGYRSIYVHLKRADVAAGDVVAAGEVIGAEGSTGFSTGCHLHYGLIRMDGSWQDVVPRLARFGYPPLVRERVDALRVLDWTDPAAPQKLQDRANASPSPAP